MPAQALAPQTSNGRARSAKNAFRHGLSVPAHPDPAMAEAIEVLARQIAGADAPSEIKEHARRFAEANMEVRRVRSLRHDSVSRALADPKYDTRANWNKKVAVALRIARKCAKSEQIPEDELKLLDSKLRGTGQAGCNSYRDRPSASTGTNVGRCRDESRRRGISMRHESDCWKRLARTGEPA